MSSNLTLEDYPFHHCVQTRWKDLDAFRHINNAVFLSYIEDARIVLLKRWKINYEERSLIVASVKIDYIRQVLHPSKLIIGQKVSRIGTKSFDIESVIFNKECNELVCKSIVTSVAFNFELNKTIEVFDEIKQDYKL